MLWVSYVVMEKNMEYWNGVFSDMTTEAAFTNRINFDQCMEK